ncbi:glycosyltransferase family 9 protein [Stappia indica]|uniref:glycosyltransferase family 9 protein n=1 Tax=Stappia indica TaxID=538381 RepID=UPI001CD57C23|nr:glycosyltransferase family 9 protein [Stappia indica]MCA1300790.1 glycosyltransferase [Stappia indica]
MLPMVARYGIRSRRFWVSRLASWVLVRVYPRRHEGWRLRVETASKSGADARTCIRLYQEALARKKLDDKAKATQAAHLINSCIRKGGGASVNVGWRPGLGSNVSSAAPGPLEAIDEAAAVVARREEMSPEYAVSTGRMIGDLLRSRPVEDAALVGAMARLVDACVEALRPSSSPLTKPRRVSGFYMLQGMLAPSGLQGPDALGGRLATMVVRALDESDLSVFTTRRRGGTTAGFGAWMRQTSSSAVHSGIVEHARHTVETTIRGGQKADAAFDAGDHARALDLYAALLSAKPGDRRSLDRMTACLKAMKLPDAARRLGELAGPAIATVKKNEILLHRLAIAMASLEGEGRHLKSPSRLQAEDFLDAALRRNPGKAGLWSERVYIHLSRQEFSEADAAIADMAKACPGEPLIPVLKSVAARMAGRLDEAVGHAEEAVSHPQAKMTQAALRYGDALRARGQIAAAELAYGLAVESAPGNAESKRKCVEMRVALGAVAAAARLDVPSALDDVLAGAIDTSTYSRDAHLVVCADGGFPPLKQVLKETGQSGFIVLASREIDAGAVDALVREARDSVGLTYLAAPGSEPFQSAPDVSQAYAIALRPADLAVACEQAGASASLQEALQVAVFALDAQFVPGGLNGSSASPALERVFDVEDNSEARPPVLGVNPAPGVDVGYVLCADVALARASRCERIQPGGLRRASFANPAAPIVVGWKELSEPLDLLGLQAPLIINLDGLSRAQREAISSDEGRAQDWRALLTRAASVIVTDVTVEHWLEDTFRIGVAVSETAEQGLDRALSFLGRRFLLMIGAGIGNMLLSTPLIRFLHARLGVPIDICIHSKVGVGHELFGESGHVNLVYHAEASLGGRRYDYVFQASTMGAMPMPALAPRVLSQRAVYDFYGTTRYMSEARYYFNGLANLLECDPRETDSDLVPFVRRFDEPTNGASAPKPTNGAKVAIAAGRSGAVWGNRQWPHFAQLAQELSDVGVVAHSVGGPGEAIAGCIDLTGLKLRDSIERLREMDVFVGADGGAFHIADALQVPTVVIFGPTGVLKNGPMVPSASVMRSTRACAPCQFRKEFTSCNAPMCMSDVTLASVLREVLDKIRLGGTHAAHSVSAAIELEVERRGTLVRDSYQAQFAAESFSLYPYLSGKWSDPFKALVTRKRMDRARQLLDWRVQTAGVDDELRYERARFSYVARDYDAAITYCLDDIERVQRPWVLRNILLRSHIARGEAEIVVALWRSWDVDEEVTKDRVAWVEAATIALRALASLGEGQDAAHLKDRLLVAARGEGGPLATLKQELGVALPRALAEVVARLDDTPYRLPHTRFDPPEAKLAFALVGDWASRPVELAAYNRDVDIFCLKPGELKDEAVASKIDFIVMQKDATDTSPLAGMWERLDMAAPCRDTKGRELAVFANVRHRKQAGEAVSLSDILQQNGVALPISGKKRLLVAAHHHLEKHNPRGGERSTRAIVQQLKEEGYEVLVVVENKKTDEACLDETDRCRYVVAGHHVFADTLAATIAGWRPDGVLTYGGAGLTAAHVCQAMDVPYIFFPRDWGEVCPKPYVDLLDRPPVHNNKSRYKSAYTGAFKIITNARYVAQVLQRLYGVEATTSYVPVTPPPGAAEIRPLAERSEILLINASKWRGGEIVRQLATSRPDWRFRVIGGDGKPFPPNVRVEPFFDGPDFSSMYRNARVFLFPLGNEIPCGTGRVVFEALICKTPTISTERGGMKEVLPPKWLASDDNVDTWLQLLDRTMSEDVGDAEFERLMKPFDVEAQLKCVSEAVRDLVRPKEQMNPSGVEAQLKCASDETKDLDRIKEVHSG